MANYEIIKRRSKRARSRMRGSRQQMGHAKGQMEAGYDRWQQELGETSVAQKVLGEAQQRGLGDFQKTESGQILKRFTGRTGIDLGRVVSTDAGQLRTWGRKYEDRYKRNNKDYDEWSSTLGAKGRLDFHFQGGGKQAWGYVPGSADADRGMRRTLRKAGYDRNVNDLYTTKGGGIRYEKSNFLTGSCNPWSKKTEDRTGDIQRHVENRITDRYSRLKQDQDVIGILTGVQKGKYGRDQHVGTLESRKGFKDYKQSFASEQQSFDKEKSESDHWSKIYAGRKSMFSSAKTKFDEASSTYATAKQSQRKFERMGLADPSNLKSKKFKRGKAGAGSYIA